MFKIKKVLFLILGTNNYLLLLNRIYFLLYKLKLLKLSKDYKYHYFAKKIINKGDYVLDIGANLGYFSLIFSDLVGDNGKVVCVEPLPIFFSVLEKIMKNKKNSILYNYALGSDNKKINMVLPKINGFFRTGLSHVSENDKNSDNNFIFEVDMVKIHTIMENLPKINFIKIDVEGYEINILPDMKDFLIKHEPIIQIEIWEENKEKILAIFNEINYQGYVLNNNKLEKININNSYDCDYLFIHKSKKLNFL